MAPSIKCAFSLYQRFDTVTYLNLDHGQKRFRVHFIRRLRRWTPISRIRNCRILWDFPCFCMISYGFSWNFVFRHYVSAVVQKSSSPTHPGGKPPSIWCARLSLLEASAWLEPKKGQTTLDMVRARERGREGTENMVDDVGENRTHSMHCTPHDNPDFTAGTVALLFKPHAVSSARAATYIKFPCVPRVPWLEDPFWTPSNYPKLSHYYQS